MSCPHGSSIQHCYECDVLAMEKLRGSDITVWSLLKDMVKKSDPNITATANKVRQSEEMQRFAQRMRENGLNLPDKEQQKVLNEMATSQSKKKGTVTVQGKRVECQHEEINYVTNGKGGYEVWCKECGVSQPERRAKELLATADEMLGLPARKAPEMCGKCWGGMPWNPQTHQYECTTCPNTREEVKKDEEHELDVIQRLSQAYRDNEREIESKIDDEEKRKTLGTLSTGPK